MKPLDRAAHLVVQAGGHIFSVTVFSGLDDPTAEAVAGVADLSAAIAERLDS